MARKTVGYIELEWTCPRCGNENPGPRKFCNGCGGPQPEDVEFHQPAQGKLISDVDKIAQAQSGPDVHCPYCQARNPSGVSYCGACGGDLSQAVARSAGQVVGAFQTDPDRQVACSACGTLNFAAARECAGCGRSLAESRETAQPESKPSAPKIPGRKLPGWIVVMGGLACIAAAVFLFSLLTRTDEIIGTVSSVNWKHEQAIEVLGPVESEAWRDEVPSGAELGSCTQDLRETKAEPVSDSVEVCGTPYTVDTGSGYGEVVQDCVYEVYDDWCTYTETAWTYFETLTLAGSDLNPTWPDPVLDAGQRLGDRQAEYDVAFESDGEIYHFEPADEDAFQQFQIGSRWLLAVNGLGAVVSLEPAQ